ncbi:STAND family AAA ATPase [Acerihabitans arboris]|uniref:Metallophosphoesterase n=1 Tax=Acerihabitans arboris TaxID=2691583 RepID=A0A845SNW6_9GAMM|nr:metallophosphoesterase [Acerihabitans arboris]NDL64271.1 metallophosphoesterase [Acerihabitans arboris]
MNKTLFVNLSDIHIKNTSKNNVLEKLNVFVFTLKSLKEMGGFEKIILLVSGDLAFSGSKEEYDLLVPIFEELATCYDLIMCPGNHDHNFSSYKSSVTRNTLIKIDPELQDEESIDIITKGMKDYFEFESNFETLKVINSTPLSKQFEIKSGEGMYLISTLNTAWCSQIHEHGGDICFPQKFIPKTNKKTNGILFFHHPLSWFSPDNQKAIRNIIREEYAIILTGHEHLKDEFTVKGESNSCLMIETMPFDDPSIVDNGFITFHIESNDIILTSYKWSASRFLEDKIIRKSDILKASSISNSYVTVNHDFNISLHDIGVSYIHPDKEVISLEDVFVYPNLKSLDADDKFDLKKISSENLLDNDKSKIVLIGDEYCGKSTLLKKIFIDSIEKNKLPLLIDGGSIRNGGTEYDKIIARHVAKQYIDMTNIEFISSSVEKVLLLDGFDYIKGDRKSIEIFLERSSNIFKKIIITVSDTFDFSGSEFLGDGYFDKTYFKYEISKLGHRLRYELVNKWNQLKEECQNEKGSLVFKNNHAVKTISQVIGRNYVPSTPFFLLTLLQSMENGNALEVSANTYGYYYEYLITQSLGNASVKKEELDEFFNYVKELSNYFFKNNLKEDSNNNLWDFNANFCEDYGVKIDFQTRCGLLVRAKILEKKDNDYFRFKYPYVYYFFIAKYLSDTITHISTISTVDNLIATLGKRRSMSILMFLTHHSRDESILDKVIAQARTLFSETAPTKLELDTNLINKIVDQLSELPVIYENQNKIDLRRKVESQIDEFEENDHHSLDTVLDEDDDFSNSDEKNRDNYALETSDFMKSMNLTFKSLEILGQLSRNYYGSLKVIQKKKLLDQAIKAPLRSLGYFFTLIEDNTEATLDMVEKRIIEKYQDKMDVTTSSDVRESAKRFLFELTLSISFFFITKISSSIGSIHLQQVISEVCDEIGSNSGKLIKLATLLEMGNAVSIDELRRFINGMERNHLSDRLLKSIVLNYLYMFERSDTETQQICSISGINYGSVSKQIGFHKLK